MKKILHILKETIETLWDVFAIIWNLPIGIVEIVWDACFNREKFNNSMSSLKEVIKR